MAVLCLHCETKNFSRIDDTQWACFHCGWIEENPRLSEMIDNRRHSHQKSTRDREKTSHEELHNIEGDEKPWPETSAA